MRNHVFISYRHESAAHAKDVRRLGLLLQQAGIPVALDQFLLDERPGGPDEGWPKWCEDNANQSQCVLIVASEGWFRAYEKTASAGSGYGAATEADVFRQALWDEKGHNARIRLAFLQPGAITVPVRLRAWHQFRPFDHGGESDQLIRWVAACLGLQGIEPGGVRWPDPVEFQPDIADRNQSEWPAVVDLLAGRSRERILLIQGPSGVGKSELIRQAKAYARTLAIPIAHVDLKGGLVNVNDVLGAISVDLGGQLSDFVREGANKTHLLRKDLRSLRRPVFVIFDTYEAAAGNPQVADWLCQHFLAEVETSPALTVVVAGQQTPDRAHAGWREISKNLPLEAITEYEAWKEWVSRKYPDFHDKGDLLTLLKATRGSPLQMATLCAVVANG